MLHLDRNARPWSKEVLPSLTALTQLEKLVLHARSQSWQASRKDVGVISTLTRLTSLRLPLSDTFSEQCLLALLRTSPPLALQLSEPKLT